MVTAAVMLFFSPLRDSHDVEFQEGRTREWLETHVTTTEEESEATEISSASRVSVNQSKVACNVSTVSKSDVKKSLAFVSSYCPQACPCRGSLKQVYNFLREQDVDLTST